MIKRKKLPRPMIHLYHTEFGELILKVRFTGIEEKYDFNVDQEKMKAEESLKEIRKSSVPINALLNSSEKKFRFPPHLGFLNDDVEEDIPIILQVLNPEYQKNTKTKEIIEEIEFFTKAGSYRKEDMYTFVREKLKREHQIAIPKFDPKVNCFEELTQKITEKPEKKISIKKMVSDIIENHKDVKGKLKLYETPSSQMRIKITKILKLEYKVEITEENLRQILKRLDFSESRTL